MLVSIGILAWNEEDVIEKTLISLFNQSCFNSSENNIGLEWELIIIPNGCTDNTAKICYEALPDIISKVKHSNITYSIQELKEAGKSNAWNYYIHDASNKKAEIILMLDADIEFNEPDTILNTINSLIKNKNADVSVDLPLKDVLKKKNISLIERISTATSNANRTGPVELCGQYFCAKAKILRQIWMPKGMPVEDGFLRAMIVTDYFRSINNEDKIIRAENASHYYQTVTSLKEIFKHEVRIVVGTAMNCYLTWDLLYFATDPSGPGAGIMIKNQIEKNPLWYKSLIQNAIKNRGYWVIPRGMLFRRFSQLKSTNGTQLIRASIISIIGFAFDLPVFIVANQKLKKGDSIGLW